MRSFLLICVWAWGTVWAGTVVDFGQASPSIREHEFAKRGQTAAYGDIPGGGRGIHCTWDRAAKPTWLEFSFADTLPTIPDFTTIRLTVRLRVPEGSHSIRRFNLRVVDATGEVFQTPFPGDQLEPGIQTLHYELDARKEQSSWGGNGDHRYDFPLRLSGFACDFQPGEGPGEVWILGVGYDAITGARHLEPELATGNPIRILEPGQENQLRYHLTNVLDSPASYRVRLVLRDHAREVWTLDLPVSLPPLGKREFPLPAPDKLGIFYLSSQFQDTVENGASYTRNQSFAYMRPTGPTPGRAEGFLFGVCSHPQRNSPEIQELEAQAAAFCGAKVMREDIQWSRMEPAQGDWQFGSFDTTVEIFGRYNVELEAIYSYCTPWAVAKDWQPLDTSERYINRGKRPDYDYWRLFIREVSKRYRGKIRFFEVWNEPDLFGFANFSAAEYIEMLRIAREEQRQWNPEALLLTGGYACMPPYKHMNDPLHQEKTLAHRDSYDVHAFHGHGPFEHYFPQIERMIQMRERLGVTAPWWANETAISSVHVGELVQAETLFKKLLYSWARGSIGYNWYDLRNDGYSPSEGEHNFGMVTRDFYPKAVYPAYNTIVELYRGGEYRRDLDLGGDTRAFLFQVGEHYLIPCWSNQPDGSERLVPLRGVGAKAEFVDLFGNMTELPVHQGTVILPIGRAPGTCRIPRSDEFAVGSDIIVLNDRILVRPGGTTTGEFTLHNPLPSETTFAFSWTLPPGVEAEPAKQTATLPALGTQAVRFTLRGQPDLVLGGQPQQVGLMVELAGSPWQFKQNYTLKELRAIGTDGQNGRVPDLVLDSATQLVNLVIADPTKAHLLWKGREDCSGKVWLSHNADGLLLEATVLDDRHHQPQRGKESYQGDGFQLGLSLPGQNGFWEFGLSLAEDGKPETFVWHAPRDHNPTTAAQAVRLTVVRDENRKTTTYQAAIPFATIGLTDTSQPIAYNLLLNDNDGEMRESYLQLAPGQGGSKNPALWPLLLLSGTAD